MNNQQLVEKLKAGETLTLKDFWQKPIIFKHSKGVFTATDEHKEDFDNSNFKQLCYIMEVDTSLQGFSDTTMSKLKKERL